MAEKDALMNRNGIRWNARASQWIAGLLSLALVSSVQPCLYAQMPPPGGYAPMDATQLNQLVAPIALYPDSLVAQILTAATYPQQVMEADGWIHQYGGMPPDQLGNAVNAMPWDPSVKALTAFPSVLDNMARNSGWTRALGNAYYNQPGDVMNAVQAMRFQAQQAGMLRSTPQMRVYDNGGLVVIGPVNPAFVYVPYYNPWAVYGVGISPWGGYYVMPPPRGVVIAAGIGIGFGVGISLGLFAHYAWGYHAWAPNWRGGVVVYNHVTYVSRSTTVINRGNFGGFNRGVYERVGRGVPNGFRPPVTGATAQFHAAPGGFNRPGPAAAPGYRQSGYANDRPSRGPAGAARPEMRPPASNVRPQGYNAARAPAAPQARPAPQMRPAPQAHTAPQARPESNSREGHAAPGGGHAQPRGGERQGGERHGEHR
jgi:Protein of unknown function (DUF3300)